MAVLVDKDEWIPLTIAERRSGLSLLQLKALVDRREIGRLEIPGMKPRISWSDLERVVAESHRPRREKPDRGAPCRTPDAPAIRQDQAVATSQAGD